MILSVQHPVWGETHAPGYIGFIHHLEPTIISVGIGYFQGHSNKYDEIVVTHALVVSDENECIEAQPSGVKRASLTQYFDDPSVAVVFRKPRGWTQTMGGTIVSAAAEHLGHKYAYTLILAQALAHSRLGRWLNKLTANKPNKWVSKLLDYGSIEFCSELAAKALQAVPELRGCGILTQPARLINVQMLFNSREIFEDWKSA